MEHYPWVGFTDLEWTKVEQQLAGYVHQLRTVGTEAGKSESQIARDVKLGTLFGLNVSLTVSFIIAQAGPRLLTSGIPGFRDAAQDAYNDLRASTK